MTSTDENSKSKFMILDNMQSENQQVRQEESKTEEIKEQTPEEFKNHKLIKMKAHNYYYCKDCNEVIKEDGHLLETGIYHGIKKD